MKKYLYIDDEGNPQKVSGFTNQSLVFSTETHKDNWEDQIKYIRSLEDETDGILLDLRLNDFPNQNQRIACFGGTSLAQEIRTWQKERTFKNLPIVLFSANDKKSLDHTAKDLFDICIDKSSVNFKTIPIFRNKMLALAEGYKRINERPAANDYLGIERNEIDPVLLSELEELKDEPTHILARFIISELLMKQGLLINEFVLAARLGLDIEQSHDWQKLKEILCQKASYKGVFNEGWPRWWMYKIQDWWDEIAPSGLYLRSTSAAKRVEIIKKETGIKDLVPAEKIEKTRSDEYWTICAGCNRPLDPIDGLLVAGQDNLFSWQEPEYVSVEAALNRENKDEGWKDIAEIERDNFEILQNRYSQKK